MNEANAKFKKLFMKMLTQVETWQDTQQITMDTLSTLIQECKHFNSMNLPSVNQPNESFVGVFSQFPQTVLLVQSTYIAQLEQLQQKIHKYNQIQQGVCTALNKLQWEAFNYYEQQKLNLNTWMDLNKMNLHKSTSKYAKIYEQYSSGKEDPILQHPFYIIAQYLHETQEIFVMFQKELNEKKPIIDQIDYFKSTEELTRLYQLLSEYTYVDVEKVIQILETAEDQVSK